MTTCAKATQSKLGRVHCAHVRDKTFQSTASTRRRTPSRFDRPLPRGTHAGDGQFAKPSRLSSGAAAVFGSLQPWLEPGDGPPSPRAVFTLLENCTFDET